METRWQFTNWDLVVGAPVEINADIAGVARFVAASTTAWARLETDRGDIDVQVGLQVGLGHLRIYRATAFGTAGRLCLASHGDTW